MKKLGRDNDVYTRFYSLFYALQKGEEICTDHVSSIIDALENGYVEITMTDKAKELINKFVVQQQLDVEKFWSSLEYLGKDWTKNIESPGRLQSVYYYCFYNGKKVDVYSFRCYLGKFHVRIPLTRITDPTEMHGPWMEHRMNTVQIVTARRIPKILHAPINQEISKNLKHFMKKGKLRCKYDKKKLMKFLSKTKDPVMREQYAMMIEAF